MDNVLLIDKIGTPAMLEQTAEECSELAQACLKLARYMRGENMVYKSKDELYANLAEEMADIMICMNELLDSNVISHEAVDSETMYKQCRMRERLNNV